MKLCLNAGQCRPSRLSKQSAWGKTFHSYLCMLLQGKVVSFPEVPGHPIVTDVPWFMRLLNLLQEQKDVVSLQNGARCKALAPDVPMFDLAIIGTVFGSEATSELVSRAAGSRHWSPVTGCQKTAGCLVGREVLCYLLRLVSRTIKSTGWQYNVMWTWTSL